MRIIKIGIAIIVIIILIIGGYYLIQMSTEPIELEKVTLGVESSLLPAAVWVAEDKGYFEEEGLDLTIEEFDSGRLSFLDMLNEGVDISAAAPTPIMFNSFDRQDFSIFATFAYAYEDIKVIARKDKGIITAADLKGKKIGTAMGTTGQFFIETFLIQNAISPNDVELVNIAPSDLPSALNKGEIDAQVIWEPHGSDARKLLGDKAIRLPSSDVYKTTFNFLVMRDFAEENPEVLKKFLRAIDKATIFINQHEKDHEGHIIVARRLNVDHESMDVLWKDFVFKLSLDHSLLISLEDEARWAIKNNLTSATEIPNYLDYIYFDALKEVKPNAIGIIH